VLVDSAVVADVLPYIDEHHIEVGAPADRVWLALGKVVASSFAQRAEGAGRVLGVRPATRTGDPLVEGSTLVGFRVERAEPGKELALYGEHRFSRYSLTFRLDRSSPERTLLRAETRAVFPRPTGKVYRALVIGSRGHVLVVRRMLRAVKRRAER
jgi:hypothetical protein